MRKFLFLALLMLGACAGTKAAYREATGLYEQAYVVTEHYSVLLEQANTLAPALTEEERTKLRGVRDRVNPIVLQLQPLATAWQTTRSATDQASLEAALAQASVAVADFVAAVKEARE